MEDWAAAFDSAQQPTKPPESPEEESMIKNDWMKYFSHPAVSQGLLQMGTALLQPMQPGETFAGRFSSSMSKGAETIGNAAEQNFGMEQKAEQKTYDRGRDAKSDARADAEAKRAGAGLSLAERKFQYDQSQNELARDDAKTAAQQAAELDRLKIASGVYEKLVANTTAGTPPEEINQMAQDIFSQMQGMTGAKSAINPQVAGSDVVGEVAQPTTSGGQGSVTSGGEPAAGQEVAPQAQTEQSSYTPEIVENHINQLKAAKVKEQVDKMGPGAAAFINSEASKYPKEVRQRILDYLVKGI